MSALPHSLVIGGTRGLGRVVAQLLHEADHRVSVIGRREPEQAEPHLRYWAHDLADDVGMRAVLTQVREQGGPLNYVVFCQRYRGKDDPWTGELQVTLTLTRNTIEALREDGWAGGDKGMVMVSSVFGEWIGEGQPVSYHVAKAGLLQLMRYYAVNLGPQGIRANAVTPFTFLKAESQDFYLGNDALMEVYRQSVPLGRLARTEEIARVIRFLCSSEASYLTGQNLHVDGGLSAVWPETLARRIKGV